MNCIYCHKDLDGEAPLQDPNGNDCCEDCFDSRGFAVPIEDPTDSLLDEVDVDEMQEF